MSLGFSKHQDMDCLKTLQDARYHQQDARSLCTHPLCRKDALMDPLRHALLPERCRC